MVSNEGISATGSEALVSSGYSANASDHNETKIRKHPLEVTEESSDESSPDSSLNFDDMPDRSGPSNERLLGTAFLSFTSFALIQLFFAFVADSEAMKGDSAAMLVDAMTYLFNYIAEVRKNSFDRNYVSNTQDEVEAKRIRAREKRKLTLQLEIIPPIISVCTLIVITIIVMRQSIRVLLLDLHRSQDEQSIPNIGLMMGFSVFNLGLDFMNVFCFAKAKHLFGYPTTEGKGEAANDESNMHELPPTRQHEYDHVHEDSETSNEDPNYPREVKLHEDEHANLNMCSAYTHVFADTLRSIAVIVAAAIAFAARGITPEEADATAAVIVSILILLSLIPLFRGLFQSAIELRGILVEEKAEGLLRLSSHEIV